MARTALIIVFLTFASMHVAPAAEKQPGDRWHDAFYPYRIRLQLTNSASGKASIELPIEQLIETLKPVCIDVLNEETIAFDKAMLVDPAIGKSVGGFRLIPVGEPMNIGGDFAALAAGRSSKWQGSALDAARFEDVEVGGQRFKALSVSPTETAKSDLRQPLKLEPGGLYLLEYQVLAETTKGHPSVSLYDPTLRIFDEVHCSYARKLTPHGQWTRQQVLYQPDVADVEMRIGLNFAGKGAVGAVNLRRVKWALIADLPAATSSLDLYLVMQAGHRMTPPTDALLAPAAPRNTATTKTKTISAEAADLNPDGFALDAGEGIRLWSVPSYLPLRAETLKLTEPRASTKAKAVRASILRGQSTSLLFAIDTLTPYAQFTEAACDLPVESAFHHVAAIPVFDSFWPEGKQFETRHDAMVELNFPLTPPDRTGIHIISCTLSAPADAKPGIHAGKIVLVVQNQEPVTKKLEVPVELTVLSPTVKPMWHFGTIFAGNHLTAKFEQRPGVFETDSITGAEYHGFRGEGLEDTFLQRLSRPDKIEPQKTPIRDLSRKYAHRLIDFNIGPKNPTLFSIYTYQIEDRGEGKAPTLSDWNFDAYDEALEQVVLARDIPWLPVWHTNGHLIDMFELSDGITYSIRPRPEDESGPWKQLPKDQYISMVAEYFEAIAAHLDKKKLLDRALIVLDEADETTYPITYDVIQGIHEKPHAQRIKVGHTTYKTSVYTDQLPDGRIIMDVVLDVPIPINDEHYNYFDPEWMARFKRPGKIPWVYYVETDHFNLDNAGLSTVITPLKLRNYGIKGWYNWGSFLWSLPYVDHKMVGFEYTVGPTGNPWLNPYNHHGYGMLSFFYPPDPRGPADEPTERVVPSWRLANMRDGIQEYALLDLLEGAKDDDGATIKVDPAKLQQAQDALNQLWADNPVQWYLSYDSYRRARQAIYSAFLP